MTSVILARRAIRDLRSIKAYSVKNWGPEVAREYMGHFESALTRLREHPGLLQSKKTIHDHLLFYRVQQYYLVCTRIEATVYVLSVRHGSEDLQTRIAELEPQLEDEARILHHRLKKQTASSR